MRQGQNWHLKKTFTWKISETMDLRTFVGPLPNNISSMKHALKSVPGLADVGDSHGGKDGARTLARGSRSKKHPCHVDQREKLKG